MTDDQKHSGKPRLQGKEDGKMGMNPCDHLLCSEYHSLPICHENPEVWVLLPLSQRLNIGSSGE